MADDFQRTYQRTRMLRASRNDLFKFFTAGPLRRLFVVDAAGLETTAADAVVSTALELVETPLPRVRIADGLASDDHAIATAILEGVELRRGLVREIVMLAISACGPYLLATTEQVDPLPPDALGYPADELDMYAAGKYVDAPRGRIELRALVRGVP